MSRKLNLKARCHKMEENSHCPQWAICTHVSEVLVRIICILLYVECWIKEKTDLYLRVGVVG